MQWIWSSEGPLKLAQRRQRLPKVSSLRVVGKTAMLAPLNGKEVSVGKPRILTGLADFRNMKKVRVNVP